jgi:hypothetical protein
MKGMNRSYTIEYRGSDSTTATVEGPLTNQMRLIYTRKNAQVVTGLQTSCYESVHKLSTSCVRTACS